MINPLNRNSEKWAGVYFSHSDSSTLIHKRIDKLGWILNLVKPVRID